MSEEWYFQPNKNDDLASGPFNDIEFREFIGNKFVTPDTLVKQGDDGEWKRATDIQGLFGTDKPAPPPAPEETEEQDKGNSPSIPKGVEVGLHGYPYAPDYDESALIDTMTGKRIVCPHCWTIFPRERILHIAQHPSLIGDNVVGENEPLRFLPTRYTPERQPFGPKGMVCPDMACPHCHLRIPSSIIDLTSLFFSVVGAPQSGKSYFLAAMVNSLRNDLSRRFKFSFTDADAMINYRVNEYEEQLFRSVTPSEPAIIYKTDVGGAHYSHVELNDMHLELPMPFIFKLQPLSNADQEKEFTKNLILYDNAGEHFLPGDDDVSRPATRHLVHSHGLIFLFDPVLDPDMRRKCGVDDPQLELLKKKVTNQERLLMEMIRRIRLHGGMNSTEKYCNPLIIAVSKYDLWESLLPMDLRKISPWKQDKHNMSRKVDMDVLLNVSYHVRELLFGMKTTSSFVTTAESFSKRVLFIPFSSLGCSPEVLEADKSLLGVKPDNVNPVWAGTPALALLAAQGYVPISELSSKGKKITKFNDEGDYITFIRGSNEEMERLPSVYFGASLLDYDTGQYFKIPKQFDWPLDDVEKNSDDFWNN